ncbi:hypothetical protein [Acetobacterium bakii]|uniref:DUF3221 domain-containing protein n=1 Tax=Acetobacterium bakii TaxID=52689 RepID=A0A0L6TW65_9FIRM|nr:hypothetical protein [Acetobacterium bakii]KNZ40506.1 hypothetical protein AKG39_17290 [Acetobacterium bakii]
MKKRLLLVLIVALVLGLTVGCTSPSDEKNEDNAAQNTSFNAVIDEVSETELLVTVTDDDTFDRARVNLQGITLDFVPAVGQTIYLTISPQVGMSDPPFVNPIEITLVK